MGINHRYSQHPHTPTLTPRKLRIFTPVSAAGSSDFQSCSSNSASENGFCRGLLGRGGRASSRLRRHAGSSAAAPAAPPLLSGGAVGGGCSPQPKLLHLTAGLCCWGRQTSSRRQVPAELPGRRKHILPPKQRRNQVPRSKYPKSFSHAASLSWTVALSANPRGCVEFPTLVEDEG